MHGLTQVLRQQVWCWNDLVVLEDVCWLRPKNDAQHINLVELDATLNGLNLALQWQAKVMYLHTDSLCVYHCLSNTLTGKARVRTKATSEMLIRRRLVIVKHLVDEYSLQVDITLVQSEQNLTDKLTRMPKRWIDIMKQGSNPPQLTCAVLTDQLTPEQIHVIHRKSGHPGIHQTTYFVQRVCPTTTKATIKAVIHSYEECQRIDPAPTWWEKGKLEVEGNWCRIGMDITHYDGKHFLTLTDCGPTRFTIWHLLTWQDTLSIIRQLRSVFFEHGPPLEILTDNASTFWCQEFQKFTSKWGIKMCYQCAYFLEGNSIAEHCHRTVKRIAARTQCSIPEALYWYNVMPKDNATPSTEPANGIYHYKQRIKGIDVTPSLVRVVDTPYKVEDRVWVKPLNPQCTTRFGSGKIDEISPKTMLVGGVPHHVKDVRSCYASSTSEDDEENNIQFEDEPDPLLPLQISPEMLPM